MVSCSKEEVLSNYIAAITSALVRDFSPGPVAVQKKRQLLALRAALWPDSVICSCDVTAFDLQADEKNVLPPNG